MQNNLYLLTTDGCHLCDIAKAMCLKLGIDVELVDIIEDDSLVDLYGDKIPVLIADKAQQALFWPFEQEQIEQYIEVYGINSN